MNSYEQELLESRICDLNDRLDDMCSKVRRLNKFVPDEFWLQTCKHDLTACRNKNCPYPAHYYRHDGFTEVYITASKFESDHEKHIPMRDGQYYRLSGRVDHGIFTRNNYSEVRIWTCEWK